MTMKAKVYEEEAYRNKVRVFKDRTDAGEKLGRMLTQKYGNKKNSLVLAIPSGGVPVGLAIRERLGLPFDLAIARKLQIPGNTEAGFGAMSYDGTVFLNEDLLAQLGLTPSQIEAQADKVRRELEERNRLFRGGKPFPDLHGQTVLLVDDGLASGYTMKASVHAVERGGAEAVVVAVPTAPARSVEAIRDTVREVYCANIREQASFAVAEAYQRWFDLDRDSVLRLLNQE